MSPQTTLSGWLSKAKTLDRRSEPGVEKENLGGGEHGEGGGREKKCWETWKFRFDERLTKAKEGELIAATYNIRGGAEGKTINLATLMNDHDIDILAIQETKCPGRQAYWGWKKMIEEKMVTVWADARGTSGGVGLVLREKWGRHILQTDTYKNRIVSVILGFRHTRIRVVSVYWPASNSADDKKTKRKWTKWIREVCQRDSEKSIPSMWLGDWNSVIDEDIDAVKCSDKHDRWGVQVMEANGMVDTFRIVYPDKVMVSYLKKDARVKGGSILSGARLDGIWVSKQLAQRVVACDIEIARHEIEESDHVPVIAALDVMGMCTAAPRIQPQQRKVPHWHSSTEAQRKAYEVKTTSEMNRLNMRIMEARLRWMADWTAVEGDNGLQDEAEKAGCTKPQQELHHGTRELRTLIMSELEVLIDNWGRSLWHAGMSELEIKTLGIPQTQHICERKLHKLKKVLGAYVMKQTHDHMEMLRQVELQRTISSHEWTSAIPVKDADATAYASTCKARFRWECLRRIQ